MAELYLGDGAGVSGVARSSVMGSIVGWTGALMSVALVGGLGMWGYELAVRDVSGVPVVRALEGPMRVAPDNPGGAQANHQGFAVNTVAADGSTGGQVDRVVLAPPPLALAGEDLPKPVLAAGPRPELSQAEVLALAEELTDGATPLSATLEAPDRPITIIAETIPGVKVSLMPRPRPGDDETALAVANAVASAVAAPAVEIDASEVAPGTRLVQFGAFASPDEARAEWRRLDQKYTDFLTGKKRVIEKAISGGKTFYRLRAMGFADVSDARRFCSAFVANRHACIPVVAR